MYNFMIGKQLDNVLTIDACSSHTQGESEAIQVSKHALNYPQLHAHSRIIKLYVLFWYYKTIIIARVVSIILC